MPRCWSWAGCWFTACRELGREPEELAAARPSDTDARARLTCDLAVCQLVTGDLEAAAATAAKAAEESAAEPAAALQAEIARRTRDEERLGAR